MVDDKAKNEDDVFENSTGATAQACGLFSEAFAGIRGDGVEFGCLA